MTSDSEKVQLNKKLMCMNHYHQIDLTAVTVIIKFLIIEWKINEIPNFKGTWYRICFNLAQFKVMKS